jgi:hypothetical protein
VQVPSHELTMNIAHSDFENEPSRVVPPAKAGLVETLNNAAITLRPTLPWFSRDTGFGRKSMRRRQWQVLISPSQILKRPPTASEPRRSTYSRFAIPPGTFRSGPQNPRLKGQDRIAGHRLSDWRSTCQNCRLSPGISHPIRQPSM